MNTHFNPHWTRDAYIAGRWLGNVFWWIWAVARLGLVIGVTALVVERWLFK